MPVKTMLIISNGHGEDAIAAEIVRRLPKTLEISAYPMIGEGRAYGGICPIVGPRAHVASEGWRNVRHSLARDVRGGALKTIGPTLGFLRSARGRYDRVVVVGDMMGVYACFVTGHRGIFYLDVYKTGFGSSYLGMDKWMLKRCARSVFCRAQSLADTLIAAGIDAHAPGNVMMDTVPRTGMSLNRSASRAVTILPGSRAHALSNFALQVAALARLPAELRPDLFVAVASSLRAEDLASAAGLVLVDGRLQGEGLDITIVPGAALGDALDASDLVLSQAGTATVQAIGLGRPAITFTTSEDRRSRVEAESRLFGDGREIVAAEPSAIADALSRLLADPSEIARRGTVGRNRMGGTGALDVIVTALKD